MTFTSTPPTKPGFYAWRSAPDRNIKLLSIEHWNASTYEVFHGKELIGVTTDFGGQWCPLLPAEEVELCPECKKKHERS